MITAKEARWIMERFETAILDYDDASAGPPEPWKAIEQHYHRCKRAAYELAGLVYVTPETEDA